MAIKMANSGHELFELACELADTPKTRRQFKKFQRSRGLAFQNIHAARAELQNRLKPKPPTPTTPNGPLFFPHDPE